MFILSLSALLGLQMPLGSYDLKPYGTALKTIPNGVSVVYQPKEWPNVSFVPRGNWDWSQKQGLEFDVRNLGTEPVNIGVRFDDDATADGWHHSRTGNAAIPGGKSEHIIVVFGPDPSSVGMRGLPPIKGGVNAPAGGDGKFAFEHVVALQFFLHDVKSDVTLELTNVGLVGGAETSLAGIVDPFGQFTGSDWPGKVHIEKDFGTQRSAESKAILQSPAFKDRDKYGGYLNHSPLKATGAFRTEKVNGTWWLVDPEGRLFFSYGIDTVVPDESTFLTGRAKMFTWLPSANDPLHQFKYATSGMHSGPVTSGEVFNFYGANLFRKFGADYLKSWQEETLARLPSWGFNTIGNWADERFYRNGKVPYVATGGIGGSHARLSSGSDYWSTMHDPFDPQFKVDVTQSLSHLISVVKGDPWCLGYFVDNELSWAGGGDDGRYGLALGALKANSDSPGKAAFILQLQAKYGEIGNLNAAWQTQFDDWNVMKRPTSLKALNEASRKDCSIFVHRLAFLYFSTIRDELKLLDPSHLYLGCRFAWYGEEAEQAASEVCDVISYNIYDPRLDAEKWARVKRFNKPCIIGEFHFGSLDRGMFHPGLVSTPNQAARAQMYKDYVASVLTNPSFVGCHWFQYTDEPLTGRSWDGENYNIGMVSVTDTPYAEMIQAAKSIHGSGYRLRLGP